MEVKAAKINIINITKKFFISYCLMFPTHTTNPCEEEGTETETLIPWSVLCSFKITILRCISASDFGAFIAAAPRYVTPEKIVHSWSTSETKVQTLSRIGMESWANKNKDCKLWCLNF